ncbi:hypothetical protein DER46DRAFT_568730 [Fusarium sp. MPI-SDFR-AT-0072]|uniref:Uncharacterized protein n=1 Tax=Fusarium oxysporum f. sp. rapae TaxID=485398 RepID=A0A8J5UGE8_FUSOX|nr:hypothetical protein Forpe1208_v001923 [Fusarium oxysporum f. sp. rapae]KAH7182150.1 hypothetical protein DER46DRAFT_568730 [Fusarium sp. MPI-SDFR-AT-0072]
MKFSLGPILLGLATIAGVTASPVPSSDIAPSNDDVISPLPVLGVPGDHETANAETNEVAIVPRDLSDEAASGISKRAIDSFFKIHVVNGAGRVLGIIVIDYVINQLLGNHEGINAFFDKLTNVKTNGPIVATNFENGANPFKTAQNAIFDFSTKVVSGVIDLGLDASGTAVSVVSTAGIELGNLVIAKALHIFNDKNQKIGSVAI